ncbi:hypothetical protein [Paraburkholderia dinghuensis]|uniref:Porin n=1 Tax=Paraburkholderia dinghuensis TaxID=2305225 RepID=A0A3N6PL83_9BURK|nr:hypothetical protein [Paraburkholderia dinghuensis]RQH02160.1 hypothetical protein D1Y85_22015 [Paraburkholderia dinghuensis]
MHVSRSRNAWVLWHALSVAGALTIASFAHAQSVDGPGRYGAFSGDTLFSDDSDHFREGRTNAGYLFSNGWGLGASFAYYDAPDWSGAYGRGLFGQYHSHEVAQSIDARLGVNDTDGHTTATGALDYMHRVTQSTSLGLSAERDVVDSVAGIEKGLTYNSLMLVLDHQFTPRFTVGAVAGAMWFSDNNTRSMLRTRWSYDLLPNSGVSAYIKTRTYYDSNPDQGNYYSPQWLNEYSGGLSWRTALSNKVVFFVSGDLGHQNTDSGGNNIWGARIGLQNHRSQKVQWQIAVETTNNHTGGFSSGGDGYRYTSVTGKLLFPFN